MVDEKIYVLDDETELILVDKIIYDERRFLLLSQRYSDNIFICYEEDNNLFFLSDDDKKYKIIFSKLINKYESINNLTNLQNNV